MENKYKKNFCTDIPTNPFASLGHIENDKHKQIVTLLYSIMKEKVYSGEWDKKTYESARSAICFLDSELLEVGYTSLAALLSLSSEEAKTFTRYYDHLLESHLFERRRVAADDPAKFYMERNSFHPRDCALVLNEVYTRVVWMPCQRLVGGMIKVDQETTEAFKERADQLEAFKESVKNDPKVRDEVTQYYWQSNQAWLDDDFLSSLVTKLYPLYLTNLTSLMDDKIRLLNKKKVAALRVERALNSFSRERTYRLKRK